MNPTNLPQFFRDLADQQPNPGELLADAEFQLGHQQTNVSTKQLTDEAFRSLLSSKKAEAIVNKLAKAINKQRVAAKQQPLTISYVRVNIEHRLVTHLLVRHMREHGVDRELLGNVAVRIHQGPHALKLQGDTHNMTDAAVRAATQPTVVSNNTTDWHARDREEAILAENERVAGT